MGYVAEFFGATIGVLIWGGLASLVLERFVGGHWLSASERATRVVAPIVLALTLLSAWGGARGFALDLVYGLQCLPGGALLWLLKRKQYQRKIDRDNNVDTFS